MKTVGQVGFSGWLENFKAWKYKPRLAFFGSLLE